MTSEPEVIEEFGPGIFPGDVLTTWRKVQAGEYKSPDGQWLARKGNGRWILHTRVTGQVYDWLTLSSFVTLADCQESAEKR